VLERVTEPHHVHVLIDRCMITISQQ
jgi:hypothetical protein